MKLSTYICGTELKIFKWLLEGREKVKQEREGRRERGRQRGREGRKEEERKKGKEGGKMETQKRNEKKRDMELKFSVVYEKNLLEKF